METKNTHLASQKQWQNCPSKQRTVGYHLTLIIFVQQYGSFLASKDPEIIPSSIHFCSHLCSVTDMWFHPQERKTWFLRGFLGLGKEKSWYWILSYFININHYTLWWLNMSIGNARAQRTFIAGNINGGFVSKPHVITIFDGTRRYSPLIS